MDTLTHALSGALSARASVPRDAPPRSIPRRVAAGFLACAAPDLDFVVAWLGPVAYLEHHRGITHSVLMIPLWAFALSWLLAMLLREPRGWRALYGVCALALAMHIAGDLITSFGTMVFAPLSNWRAGIGTTFIIDLWFSGIIVAGLIVSAVLYRSRAPALIALAVLCGYVAFQAVLKERALDFGRELVARHGLGGATITAQPRPVSPFNWTVFVSDETTHRFAHVNLVREEPRVLAPDAGFVARLDAAYQPLARAQWHERPRYGARATEPLAREAWSAPSLQFFRWFADLPALDEVTAGPDCAWFKDLRFLTPGRDYVPFRYGACRDAAGGWRAWQRTPTGQVLLQP
ncbi:MAG: metal-dependent hydrolase [Burkholderiales bacterium]